MRAPPSPSTASFHLGHPRDASASLQITCESSAAAAPPLSRFILSHLDAQVPARGRQAASTSYSFACTGRRHARGLCRDGGAAVVTSRRALAFGSLSSSTWSTGGGGSAPSEGVDDSASHAVPSFEALRLRLAVPPLQPLLTDAKVGHVFFFWTAESS